MYIPAHFAEPDPEKLHALMRAHPLATVVTTSSAGLSADHLPLHIAMASDGRLLLRGHVARANPLWRNAADGVAALAVFAGPEAYVTPTWYPAKRDHGRAVPTWNYAVVHAHGSLRAIDDPAWLRSVLAELTAAHEGARPQPWTLDDAPSDYIDAMLRAVVGIEIEVQRLEGKYKASQNQPAANRAGVIEGLRGEGREQARAMADLVEESAPPR
ncbi:FMN-binding negative transcriptional regulator [Azoarcus olearius]|uniref:Probable negative transcriptional regulator n=1 Tax=Azoarcus sp. (strain BH72) TaxID=418699 RepID=A1K8B5_AZOSB|nr:FMN-binding negative transcriptional regulator [Azoarcus olearius]CAL95070.1 probable negative transcriptional regulator [Azoarcus olearius]